MRAYAAAPRLERDRFWRRRAHAKAHIAPATCSSSCCRCRFDGDDGARSVRGLPRAAPDQSVALHVLLRARRAARSSAHRPRRWCSSRAARARAAADRRHAAARRGRLRATPRSRRSCCADPKENAEHVMLVDLARNDLGPRGARRLVRVEPYRSIERYSHVMHIVSGVSGELAPRQRRVRPVRRRVSRRHARRRAEGARDADHRRARAGARAACTAARSAISATGGGLDQAITIRTLVFRDGDVQLSRPAPASWPTACRRRSTPRYLAEERRAAHARSSSRRDELT